MSYTTIKVSVVQLEKALLNWKKTLTEISDDFNFKNLQAFQYSFKRRRGKTIQAFQAQHRILEIKERLKEFEVSYSGLADEFGFRNVKAFHYFFNRHARICPTEYRKKLGLDKISRALVLLNDPKWSFEDIAEEVGYASVHIFAESFTRVMGMSPKEYQKKHGLDKISRSKRSLEITNNPLVEIAREAGYEVRTSFCRAFKKAVGVPPEEYRKLYRILLAKDLLETTDWPVKKIIGKVDYFPKYFGKIFEKEEGVTLVEHRKKHCSVRASKNNDEPKAFLPRLEVVLNGMSALGL